MLSLLNTTFTNTLRQGFTLVGSLLSKLKARSTYFENQACTKDTLKELDSEGLLEKASIITTPTAYSDGVLHSVKPSESPYGDFTFTRNDAGTRVNASGNIESIGVDLPRIDYRGGSGSLLLEPEATNTATDSNDFTTGDIFVSSGRGISGVVRTSNQAISPDGTNNAWSIVDNNNGGLGNSYYRWTSLNVLTNTYNTLSLFVKKQGNNDWVYLRTLGFTDIGGSVFFNISNGTLGYTDSVLNPSIEDYGNGWYRISITFNTLDSSGIIQLALATSDGINNITRDGTNGVYIYGLQAESHATRQYATSYIPTSGSIQTRGADSAIDAGSSDLISSTEGVLYAELSTVLNTDSKRISLSDGNSLNRVEFGFDIASNSLRIIVKSNDNDIINSQEVISSDITNFIKVAIKYKSGDTKVFVNGNSVGNTSTVSFSNIGTMDRLNLSTHTSSAYHFQGKVKCVAVFKEALTDAELTCLTTI
jgi:hypothetical protein